ncbi:MAG: glycosyltransferase family 9 protein [Bryobacteraceae bacterium]
MGQLLDKLPASSRVAVIRLRSLGDCVLTTPAIALLKAHRPDLEIAVVVEGRFKGVFEGNPDISALLPPEPFSNWKPRLTLNFHGGTRSMWLTAASRAKYRAGFAHHAYSFLYNQRIPRAQQTLGEERPVHTAEHLASAMFWLGVPRTEIPRAKLFAPPHDPVAPYTVIHPFASAPEKAWAPDRFLAVARQLRQSGLDPVFLSGPADDPSPFHEFRIHRNAPLSEVKSVLSGAQLFIGNDSGPAHIAAAFGIPVVVLFGPSNPVTWAPWRTEAQVLTSPEGMSGISIAQVNTAAETLRVNA